MRSARFILRRYLRRLVLAACFLPALAATVAGAMSVRELRCEFLENPLGIDRPKPRLFWKLESRERGAQQTAYQVLVASRKDLLSWNQGDLWDSGKVGSDQSVFVAYAGRALRSRQQCFWKVRVWDQHGRISRWSAPAFWTVGLLSEADWRGQWIASDLQLMDYQKKLRALPDFGMEPESEVWAMASQCRQMTEHVTNAPAVWLRKEFALSRPIRRAIASVSGLGFFELYVNGQRIGDHELDPAPSDYQKRVYYLTYDITAALRQGPNALGVVLGNGWFNLITPHLLRFYAADYIAPPELRLDLDVEFTDGSHALLGSDRSWKCTTNGPIRFNCVLGGETYDARLEMRGWATPGFDDRDWQAARPAPAPAGRLISQELRPVRRVKQLPAVGVQKHGAGWRFDLGVETVGWVKLRAKGRPGQEITIELPGAGSHSLGRYQTGKYTFRGNGWETFEPRFCYAGFQYVDVTGLDYAPAVADCVGQMVCSDLDPAGGFACSDDRLNKLQTILLRSLRNYIVHIPNDPTREKCGWTQDIETGFLETSYNFDAVLVYEKWQRDFLDTIHDNGYMPPVAPGRFDGPTINGPWWGGVVIYAPWWIYQFCGDRAILAESYPAMKAQFTYLNSIATNGIVHWGLGDWMEVGSVRPVRTPVPLTSTVAYYWFACILRDTARLLDKPYEAAQFNAAAAQIRTAFNREFLHPETGEYATGSQTCQLLPLVFGLAPDNQRDLVRQRLVERISRDHDHLSTGFVATPLLLQGLTDLGLGSLAWTLATQTNYPGFIDAVLNRGHTVMKEDWQGGLVQTPSLQGPIGTWFYHSLAGICPDPAGPGFKQIILKPETANGLSWVKAWYDCPYGRIISQWHRAANKLRFDFTIPPNTTATVYVPAASAVQITESGRPAAKSPGVTFLRQENGAAAFSVSSGKYAFTN